MGEEKRAREEEKQKKKEAKAKRKTVYKEAVEGEGGSVGAREVKSTEKVLPRNANQMWTDEDLIELARLIKKIPGGRLERWERIAEAMERTPEEVTKMAGKIKNNPSIVPKKQGKLGEAAGGEGEDTVWSQEQQRSLEVALTQFPKGSAERWDRIAGKVEGKSKEQCMARFKQLAEQVKKKKAEAAE